MINNCPRLTYSAIADNPEGGQSVKEKLESIVGVVEHGLFLNMCKLCIKGTENGAVIIENSNR